MKWCSKEDEKEKKTGSEEEQISLKSGAGATREDQWPTVIWLQGRTRKQQIAVARAHEIRFCYAPLTFRQLLSLSSAHSGSPTPHSSCDPFHLLTRALMCGEASVPRARVERRLGVFVLGCKGE